MSTGFSYSYDNHLSNALNKKYYRFSIETAGNILQGVNSILGRKKNEEGQYEVGDIPYAQYVKGEFDFAYNYAFDQRNHLVGHINVGLAYPYGNASVVPFEKRFFGGGANGVRGWSVRTLGPGNYYSENLNDFVKQTGDVKLLMNLEYRAKLFWKIEAAVFVDAGNIWNIKKYEGQEEGTFYFNKFYKQLAVAYGLGLRLDLDYLILRFDGGMKAINPMKAGQDKYPILKPNFNRDFAFHFAVGYPF
jgi:outer membrane protein assembly factor BamA